MVFGVRRVKMLGYVCMELFSKISNVCDPDPPKSQTDRQTDGQTDGRHAISVPCYALVHRAVKTESVCDAQSSCEDIVTMTLYTLN